MISHLRWNFFELVSVLVHYRAFEAEGGTLSIALGTVDYHEMRRIVHQIYPVMVNLLGYKRLITHNFSSRDPSRRKQVFKFMIIRVRG